MYLRYVGMMKSVCMRYAKDEMEAEDILQEAFISVFKNIKSYKSEGALGAWLRRITVNKAIEQFRKNKTLQKLSENVGYFQADEDFEITVLNQLNLDDLIAKIATLPVGYRTVFNLYAIEGYTHKEIGEMLKISPGTSKSQYSRARNLLNEIITSEIEADKIRLNYAN
ncbi:RNA polymerase sigma factor [Crocinitomix catalasitica]|uniref:RNA polymerase sigma factor n=1 Tax=Crocinitomix catalasitica TaxID=184607 RepID=UPI00373FCCC7